MMADTNLKQAQTRKSEQDWRLDPQRVIIQAVLASGTLKPHLLHSHAT